MSYSVYYSYDASHRMTRQYTDGAAPTPEAHYFTYNERDMVTQIQDVTASPDTNRYFTHNAVGERVVAVDGAGPTYWTYDGAKLLTEKDTAGSTLRRYRHNLSQLDRIGSAVEISDGANLYYPAFAQDGSTTRLQSPKISTGEQLTSKVYYAAYGNRVAAGFSPATTERLQALSGFGLNRLTTTQEVYVSPRGQVVLPGLGIVVNPMGGRIWNPSRVTRFDHQGQQTYSPARIGQYVVDPRPSILYEDTPTVPRGGTPPGDNSGVPGGLVGDDPNLIERGLAALKKDAEKKKNHPPASEVGGVFGGKIYGPGASPYPFDPRRERRDRNGEFIERRRIDVELGIPLGSVDECFNFSCAERTDCTWYFVQSITTTKSWLPIGPGGNGVPHLDAPAGVSPGVIDWQLRDVPSPNAFFDPGAPPGSVWTDHFETCAICYPPGTTIQDANSRRVVGKLGNCVQWNVRWVLTDIRTLEIGGQQQGLGIWDFEGGWYGPMSGDKPSQNPMPDPTPGDTCGASETMRNLLNDYAH